MAGSKRFATTGRAVGSKQTPDEVSVKILVGFPVCFAFVVLLAANGCAKTSVVGTSGEPGPSDSKAGPSDSKPRGMAAGAGEAGEHRAPKVPSVISTTPGVEMIMSYPVLGDVDGDGFDDFFVQAIVAVDQTADGLPYRSNLYLYYGRPVFPPELTTDDADAVFTAEGFDGWALGDVNGDGLSDFSVRTTGGSAIILGSETRYSGEIFAGAAGVVWSGGPLPTEDPMGFSTLGSIRPAGDVNGDGIADLIVTSLLTALPPEIRATFDFETHDYLVLGHEGAWVSGEWDPSSAVAVFGSEELTSRTSGSGGIRQPLSASAVGDLDGDGFSDLFARTDQSTFVFYGGPQRLTGELGPDRADANFKLSSGCYPYILGDLDADGRNDLAACNGATIDIVYGTKARLSGTPIVDSDFTIEVSGAEGALMSAAAGDTDSDGAPDLVVSGISYQELVAGELAQLRYLYTIRGTGERQTGTHTVSSVEGTLGPASDFGVITASTLATGFGVGNYNGNSVLSMAGDLDGDGSLDILTDGSHAGQAGSGLAITLIPSTPRAPD
jgi:hypothetical protein